MAKFGINDILNAKTKAAGQQAQTDGYKEIYLSPYEVKAAQENTHQKLENIEELADSFLHVGQEQPTVLARVNGEYRIIDGHRRNAANILNLERGHKEYEKVLYRFMDMSEAMYELRLLAGNGYTQELTAYEKTRQEICNSVYRESEVASVAHKERLCVYWHCRRTGGTECWNWGSKFAGKKCPKSDACEHWRTCEMCNGVMGQCKKKQRIEKAR